MFDRLVAPPADTLLGLITLLRNDPRPGLVDLGVGVYRDEHGNTPVMRAVKAAEKRVIDTQESKAYVGAAGNLGFNAAMADLVLGAHPARARTTVCQTTGGSGALRLIGEVLHLARPDATVWMPDPTWANHAPSVGAPGFALASYPYYDRLTGRVRFDEMIAALQGAAAGDIVVLHACCHNPTGAGLTDDQWSVVADVLAERELFPFIDVAYQGFGDGLEADVAGTLMVADRVDEFVIAVSCAKNFGVYRERLGAAMFVGATLERAELAHANILKVARTIYSMPPDHAAEVVLTVLSDPELRAEWEEELESMRRRLLRLREAVADELASASGGDAYDYLRDHRGMFSQLPLTPEQVEWLRVEHGIYMPVDGRMNIAGLPERRLDEIAAAIVAAAGR